MNNVFRSYGDNLANFRVQTSLTLDRKLYEAIGAYATKHHVSMASVFREGAKRILNENNYESS